MMINLRRLPQTTSRYLRKAYRNVVRGGVTVLKEDGTPQREPILRPMISYPLQLAKLERNLVEGKVGEPQPLSTMRREVMRKRLQRYMNKTPTPHRAKMSGKLMRRMVREGVLS